MKPTVSFRDPGRLARMEPRMRRLVEERLATGFARPLAFFRPEEAPTIRAVVERMVPHGDPKLDLVGFLDGAIGRPLGEGGWPPGVPEEPALVRLALAALDRVAQAEGAPFAQLPVERQTALLAACREGRLPADGFPPDHQRHWFRALLRKLLLGYTAHPDTWDRMGFAGPAYPDGHLPYRSDALRAVRRRRGRG